LIDQLAQLIGDLAIEAAGFYGLEGQYDLGAFPDG
jgi:hypothetical protein